jgi:pimeloyl-ACP methyl ester carboxylesterase
MLRPFILLLLVLSFCSCKQNSGNDSKVSYGDNVENGKYFDIRGFKMYVETYGNGQPLLLIHGNGGSLKQFANQIPFFAKKFKVIAADSRAQGKSQDNGDSLSYDMMADDYAALLDAMKIDSAFVAGWSDGGNNGLLLANRHPAKVKKLVVASANLWPDSTAMQDVFFELIQPAYTELKNKQARTDAEKKEWKLTRMMAEEPHIALSDLNKIRCPVLVIAGDHDLIKEEHTMLIYKNIPKAYLWILPNSGHSTLVSYKDDFNKTVDDFFSKPYREISGNERLH